jgi:hypothetical protein
MHQPGNWLQVPTTLFVALFIVVSTAQDVHCAGSFGRVHGSTQAVGVTNFLILVAVNKRPDVAEPCDVGEERVSCMPAKDNSHTLTRSHALPKSP